MTQNPIKCISHRKIAGEGDRYRPGAQQRQVDIDRFFEYRYDAYLNCQDFLFSVYNRMIKVEHSTLIKSLSDDVINAAASKDDYIYMSCLSTGLSAADRSHVVDAVLASMEQLAPIIELNATNNSAHDLSIEASKGIYEIIRKMIHPSQRLFSFHNNNL